MQKNRSNYYKTWNGHWNLWKNVSLKRTGNDSTASPAWIIYICYMIRTMLLYVTSDCIQLHWHSWILILFLVPISAEVDDQYQVSNKLQSDFNSMIQPFTGESTENRGKCRTVVHWYFSSRQNWNLNWLGYAIWPLCRAALAPRDAWRATRRWTLSRSHRGFSETDCTYNHVFSKSRDLGIVPYDLFISRLTVKLYLIILIKSYL